jgi:hypothetical protein
MEVNGQLHALATLPPRERAPHTHCIGGWVVPRAGLDAVAKRKNPCPCQESNLSPACSLVTVLTELYWLPQYPLKIPQWNWEHTTSEFIFEISHFFPWSQHIQWNFISTNITWPTTNLCNVIGISSLKNVQRLAKLVYNNMSETDSVFIFMVKKKKRS